MPFIFVGGCARSGTTLMQKVLCLHERVAGGPEFDHLVPIARTYEKMTRDWQLERQSWYYSKDELRATTRGFIEDLFRNVRQRHPEAEFISEKTPANIDVAPELLDLFPDARFIHMVRDGRDVVLSHRTVAKRFKNEHGEAADRWLKEYDVGIVSHRWNQNVGYGRTIERTAADDVRARFLTVQYETLVSEPEKELKRVCEFVGLDFDPVLLRPETIDPAKTGQDANIDNVWYTERQFGQPFNSDSVGRWKTGLSASERWNCQLRMAPNLVAMGYEVSGPTVPLRRLLDRVRGRR